MTILVINSITRYNLCSDMKRHLQPETLIYKHGRFVLLSIPR